jgi:hypothetical protein
MIARPKIRVVALSLILVLVAVGCEDERSPIAPVVDPFYPTVIVPMPATDLVALLNSFRIRYPRVCSELDEYGHPVRRTGQCFSQTSVGIDVDAPPDDLIEVTKATVADMFDFTEVSDPTALTIRRASVSGGTPFIKSFLTMRFENQRYQGREVLSTPLMAWADSLGVFGVHGHHFSEIHLPKASFSACSAKQRILGMEIPWDDVVGIEHIFVVTRDSFRDEPVQVVRPQHVGDTIELRVAWQIGVGSGFGRWYVYVDIVTGEHLGTTQLFST